jgi:biotin transport system substrate-specific component
MENNTKPLNLVMRKKYLRALALTPLFTVLMIVSAKISIPMPFLPITFQVTAAILSGLLLGSRLGLLSQILYLIMGLAGLPVFTKGGGIEYVFTGSFGYIIGFCFCAFVGGLLSDRIDQIQNRIPPKYSYILLISIISLLVCYLFGVLYLFFLSNFYTGFSGSRDAAIMTLIYGAAPYLLKDIVLTVVAAELARRLWSFRVK